MKKADSTLRSSRAVPHPSTNRALRRLTSEVERDPVHSTRYGRQRTFSSAATFTNTILENSKLQDSKCVWSPQTVGIASKLCKRLRVCVRGFLYECMHACMYACVVPVYICMYVCMHACMHACMNACMHICMYAACMYVSMYACMYVCLCVFMYVCMYACMRA